MKCINFDDKFADFMAKWSKEHAGEYRNFDAMEADMPRIYMMFLNTPARWLDGVTPGAYFTQFEDAKDLVDWMCEYCRKEIPVPDLLLAQITNVGKPCERRLLALIKDENDEVTEEAKMTAIGLLREMEYTLHKKLNIQWQLDRGMQADLADNALDSLREMGKAVVQPILQELPKANAAGQEAFLDILVNYPGPQQVFDLAVRLFKQNPGRRALFGSYLGKLGDDRALPVLMEAANDEKCGYMDFIELRSAIEYLGGEAPKREFFEDADYDALRAMEGD